MPPGERRAIFFGNIATGRFTTFHGMSHIWESMNGYHKLDLMGGETKPENTSWVIRGGSGFGKSYGRG